jgi:hypothetical protein
MADVVQTVSNASLTSPVVTITGVTAHNSLIAVVQYKNPGNVTASVGNITSSGDTWTGAYIPTNAGGFGEETAYFLIADASAGSHAITFAPPGTSDFANLVVMETVPVTGADKTATAGQINVTDAITSGTTAATTNANEIIVATLLILNTAGVSVVTPSGYTASDTQDPFLTNKGTVQTVWKTVAATGTQVASWTWSFGAGRETTASICTFIKATVAGNIVNPLSGRGGAAANPLVN